MSFTILTFLKQVRFQIFGPVAPFRGGIAHFGNALIAQLRHRGHLVSVTNFSRLYPAWIFPGKSQLEPGPGSLLTIDGSARLDSLNPITWIRVARELNAAGADIAVFQYWEPFFAPIFGTVARLLRSRGIRTICIVHNALPHEGRPGSISLGRYLLRACDGVVVLSKKVEQDVQSKIHVSRGVWRLFHPVYEHFGDPISKDSARQSLGLAADASVILFFGIVRKYKGLDILLKAIRLVRNRIEKTRLLIVGEFYEKPDKYQHMISDLGLEGCVHVENQYIPESAVSRYYCAADLVVMPYLSGSQSGVLSTAYHFSLPFVITRVEGLVEMGLVDGRYTVDPGDVYGLADVIVRFFSNDNASHYYQELQQRKRQFSWGNFGASFEAIAEEICCCPNE